MAHRQVEESKSFVLKKFSGIGCYAANLSAAKAKLVGLSAPGAPLLRRRIIWHTQKFRAGQLLGQQPLGSVTSS